MKKKFLSIIICIAACIAFLPVLAFADGDEGPNAPVEAAADYTYYSGDFCYQFYQTSTGPNTYRLSISGTGALPESPLQVLYSDNSSEASFISSLANSVTDLTLEEGITSITNTAFRGMMSGIKSVTLPSTMETIGDQAFNGCSNLISITIPEGVTTIGHYAFNACSSLSSITIPDTVTSIGNSAFEYCYSLNTINIGQTTSSLTSIGVNAFSGCSAITEITFPNSLEEIKDGAFFDCVNLQNVTIDTVNSHLSSIGTNSFGYCSKLSSFPFPDSLESIGDYAFTNTPFTTVTIPGSVRAIGAYAFRNCSSLTSVQLPDSLTRIEDGLFESCFNLATYNLPTTLTYIGDNAFKYCRGSEVELTIPSGVTYIGEYAFCSCKITSLTLPSQMEYIGRDAFSGNLFTSVNIPAGITTVTSAFCSNPNLTTVTFDDPDSITAFGKCAFMLCPNLQIGENFIPSNVTLIEDQAFQQCEQITSLNIPASVTHIGHNAFAGCTNLASVNFAEDSKLEGILFLAFYGCDNLHTVRFPSNVTVISQQIFQECPNLTTIYISDNTTQIAPMAFSNDMAFSRNGCRIFLVPAPGHDNINPDLISLSNGSLNWDSEAGLYYITMNHWHDDTAYDSDRCIITYQTYNYDRDFVGAELVGHSLSLEGDIGVNFYMEINADAIDTDSAYMEFTVNELDPQIVNMNTLTAQNVDGRPNCYRFTCRVAAKQMTDTITATFHYTTLSGHEDTIVYTYSVADYAYYLIRHRDDNETYRNASYLINRMLTYGTCAQLYFNYNTDNLPLSDYIEEPEIGDSGWFSNIEFTAPSDLPEGVTFYGASLVLESTTTLKLYFINLYDSPLIFTYNGRTLTPEYIGDYVVVSIPNLRFAELDNQFTVTVSDGWSDGVVYYTPVYYCRRVCESDSNAYPESLRYLVSSIYSLAVEASSYFRY